MSPDRTRLYTEFGSRGRRAARSDVTRAAHVHKYIRRVRAHKYVYKCIRVGISEPPRVNVRVIQFGRRIPSDCRSRDGDGRDRPELEREYY